MYKLTRPDGYDFYSGTINYRESIGTIIRVTDFDGPEIGPCGRGLHASKKPNDCFIGARIPCAAFRVKGIQPIARDAQKTRYRALKVLEEITDLDALFSWEYTKAINPLNPFKITPPKITTIEIDLLNQWNSVRDSVRNSVRASVWASVWASVRDSVGDSVRDSVGASVWASVRDSVRDSVGASVWASVGDSVWDFARDSVWASVRDSVWAYISYFFPDIKRWKYVDRKKGENPFQSCIDLWKMGLISSYDGKVWRLHGGKNAEILYELK